MDFHSVNRNKQHLKEEDKQRRHCGGAEKTGTSNFTAVPFERAFVFARKDGEGTYLV